MTNQEIDHRYPANNWFRTWFNSPYYHKLYQQHNDQEAWEFISRLVDYLQIPITEEVLDLACGKGRHARSFNKLGYQVTGLDLSEESILAAKAMAIADHAEHLDFYVHDMRQLFANNRFGLVVNLFTSFGYFPHKNENILTLEAIAQALKPNGLVVIDYLNAESIISLLPMKQVLVRSSIEFRISKWNDQDFIYKNISFEDNGKPYSFDEQVQILSIDWFKSTFEQVGLQLIDIFGDYSLNSYQNTAQRLIAIGKKVPL